jgi:uncharacterized protein YheU (UPF0270 family)
MILVLVDLALSSKNAVGLNMSGYELKKSNRQHKQSIKNLCKNCYLREHCYKPCPCCQHIINDGQRVYEDYYYTKQDEKITVLYSEKSGKVVPLNDFDREDSESDDIDNVLMRKTGQDEVDEFWDEVYYEPQTLACGIFIDRFFNQYTLEDLATKYNITKKVAVQHYCKARKRLFEVIKAYDQQRDFAHRLAVATNVMQQKGKVQKNIQWFMLKFIAKMTSEEISDLYGNSERAINRGINDIIRRAKAGEALLLIEEDEDVKSINHNSKYKKQADKDNLKSNVLAA